MALTTLRHLQIIWGAWQKFGQGIGDFIARVVLSVFYFTVFVPFGTGVRLFSDPLQLRPPTDGDSWQSRGEADTSLEAGRRQF